MKANEMERKRFDKALDEFIDFFNNLEDDVPIIRFDEDVMEKIELAKQKYGSDTVDGKINTVVRELLSWLDLDASGADEEVVEEENPDDQTDEQEEND